MWLALWFCPMHPKIRSARQKQTENTHILGKKLQRPLLSSYWWNARCSGPIMKTLFISYGKWRYRDILQNKPVYQLFHNSTNFFCKTDRQGNIRNIGKDEQNITFVYFDKVKYKWKEASRVHKVLLWASASY